eukprot:2661927-Rhodomonas_salina.1
MKSGTTVRESTVPAVFELDKRLSEGTTASEQQRKALEGGGHELFGDWHFSATGKQSKPCGTRKRRWHSASASEVHSVATAACREKAMYIRGMAKKLQGNHVEAASDLSACLALLSNDAERRHVEKVSCRITRCHANSAAGRALCSPSRNQPLNAAADSQRSERAADRGEQHLHVAPVPCAHSPCTPLLHPPRRLRPLAILPRRAPPCLVLLDLRLRSLPS